jgi:excisionase family DNA binding protein
MPQTGKPALLGVEDLADRLGVSSRYVRRLVAERRIAYLKIGHLVRFEPDVLDRWIDENRVGQLRPGEDPPAHARKIRRPGERNPVGVSRETAD